MVIIVEPPVLCPALTPITMRGGARIGSSRDDNLPGRTLRRDDVSQAADDVDLHLLARPT
jgi:hypothetical protein